MKKTKVVTNSLFECEVNEGLNNDAEFFELLCDAEENPKNVRKVISYMIGEDGKKALYDHLRNEDGIVPLDAVIKEAQDIITHLGPSKKK